MKSIEAFSWVVLSDNVAVKRMDKSAFLHHGTGIPKGIALFFELPADGLAGPRHASLVVDGRTFKAHIQMDAVHARFRLFWQADFADLIRSRYPDLHRIYSSGQEPEGPTPQMRFERAASDTYSIAFQDVSEDLSARAYWAFLARPAKYNVDDALRALEFETWTVDDSDVRAGDRVVLWRGLKAGKRGVVGLAEVLTDPKGMHESEASRPFYGSKHQPSNEPERRVWLRQFIPPNAPLWLDEDPTGRLAALSVSRGQGTVFHVEPEQWRGLIELLGGWQPVRHAEGLREVVEEAEEQAVREEGAIGDTEKQQLVMARRGQGRFREAIRERRCRITGITDEGYLIASHIKPWRSCTNEERLDGANGLLLSPNVDLLFDRGLISFADDGHLLISPDADRAVLTALGIPAAGYSTRPFSPKTCQYLAYHRANVFQQTGSP